MQRITLDLQLLQWLQSNKFRFDYTRDFDKTCHLRSLLLDKYTFLPDEIYLFLQKDGLPFPSELKISNDIESTKFNEDNESTGGVKSTGGAENFQELFFLTAEDLYDDNLDYLIENDILDNSSSDESLEDNETSAKND